MIDAHGVIKVFGMRPVLRGVNLTINNGEFLTLYGPNGAGKSTLLRILSTLARPSGGRITIGGYALPGQASQARALIGVVSHATLLYGDLSAAENLRFFARMYSLDKSVREQRIEEVLNRVNLRKRADDLVRTFSRGMQQRLAIGRAILHDPPLLFLDEPYTGLDHESALGLDNVLRDVVGRGRTVLMTSHDLKRGLILADRAAILTRGVIAYQATRAELDAAPFDVTYAEITGMASVR